jgi:hypothetical protein
LILTKNFFKLTILYNLKPRGNNLVLRYSVLNGNWIFFKLPAWFEVHDTNVVDPDSNFLFDSDVDPDPTFQPAANPYPDPDPGFQIKAQTLEKMLK